MANGAVRELITKVSFKLDRASVNSANRAIRKLKQDLNNLSRGRNNIKIGVNVASVNSAISKIKRQIANANMRINANARVMSIRASVVNLQGKISMPRGASRTTTRTASGGVGDIASAALGAAGAYGGYVGTGQIISTADAMMSLDGRIRGVTKSEKERLDVESQLYAMGQKTGASLQDLGSLYVSVARSSNKLGFAQEDNLKVAETVSKALVLGGATTTEKQATILQLGQALGSGTLQGDELRSLKENASVLMDYMAEYFHTTTAGLKEMGKEGELTAEGVMRAIIYSSEKIDKQFAEMPMTFGQAMTIMGNSWDRFILKVEQKSNVFSKIAKGMSKAFEDLGNTFDDFTTLMGTPDPNKMVTITEASTGETKQISEADYYAQKAAQNPQMVETIKQLKEFGRMLDELDGKTGNIDEQISGWVTDLLKVGTVLLPILTVLTAISALITILTPIFSLLGTFFSFLGTIGGYLVKIWKFIYPAIELVGAAIGTLSATTIAVILGIIAILALVIIYWDEICEAVNTAKDVIMEACGKAADFLAEAFDTAIKKVKSFFSDLKDFAIGVIGEIVDAIGNWLGEKIAWGKQALADLRSFASNAVDGVASTVSNAISNTQTNTYNLASAGQLPAAANSANSFFAYPQ